jgi:uncharacterized protein (TIGR00369 family)
VTAMTLIERVTAARDAQDYQSLIDVIPYAGFLGLTAAVQGDELITTMRFGPHLIGNPALPALHGGTLGALLESTAIFELLWNAETVLLPKTITITVDYLRSARPVDTYARGIVTKLGRRVAIVRAEAWQDDPASPVAAANAHFLIKQD